jgi:hypothetical protein
MKASNLWRWNGLGGVVLALALSTVPDGASQAQEHCRLEGPPTLAAGQLKVKVTCQANATAQTVRYPAGPLHLGISLYKLDNSLARVVAPLRDDGNGDALHLDAQEFRRPARSAELTFRLPANITQSHILVAIWDQKNPCSEPSARCGSSGHTLGKVDPNELPIPVDVWPRPVCNIASLQARGYFAWSATAEMGAPDADDEMKSLARVNDCWMRDASWPGLGVSLQQWRVAPRPR